MQLLDIVVYSAAIGKRRVVTAKPQVVGMTPEAIPPESPANAGVSSRCHASVPSVSSPQQSIADGLLAQRGTHSSWPAATLAESSPFAAMICGMTRRGSAVGSAADAIDHRVWPGCTTISCMPW